jgi:hypothetical protein
MPKYRGLASDREHFEPVSVLQHAEKEDDANDAKGEN